MAFKNLKTKAKTFFENDVLVFPSGLFFILAIILFATQFTEVAQFKHIPSPPYGGDLYRERGFTQHILNGEPFWSDPYFKGEYAFYPTLGYVLAAGLKIASGLNLDTIINFFPVLLTPFFIIVLYVLGKELTKNKYLAIIMACSFFFIEGFLLTKHTLALGMMFAFAFLIFFLRIVRTESGSEGWFSMDRLFAGMFLGLAALSHYITFFSLVIILSSSVAFEFLYLWLAKKEPFGALVMRNLKQYALMAAMGFVISLLFFYPIIFHYHFQTLNPTESYSLQDTATLGVSWLVSKFLANFFVFNSVPLFFAGIIALIGVMIALMNFRKVEMRMIVYWLMGIFLATGHYLVTKPLFDFSIVPGHIAGAFVYPLMLLFIVGVQSLLLFAQSTNHVTEFKTGIYIFLVVITAWGILESYSNFNNDQWTQYGKTFDAGTQAVYGIGDWMVTQTANKDVFLAHDESAFMLNALSGRSVVFSRRVHASAYADVEKKYAEGIAMFFCKDTNISKQYLKEYGVTYVYVDQYLLTYPMVANKKYIPLMEKCGIPYTIQDVALDVGGAGSPKYSSLVILPQNLTLLPFLDPTPAKQFVVGSQIYSEMYRVNAASLA